MSFSPEFPSRRTFLALSTATGLTGLSGLYVWLVAPLIEPPSLLTTGGPVGPIAVAPPEESRRVAERWLPSQPWAARAGRQLRTDDAYVYFEDWERLEDDRAVRFRPFAVVWMPKGRQSDEEPLRITSSSAFLRFASPFRLNSEPGRIVFAALEGDVHIAGADGLDVVGKNFYFSEEANRVWSDNHVRFRHGPNRGHALRLQAELIRSENPRDSVAVAGVKSIRLGRNVSMDLQLEEEMPGIPPERPPRTAAADEPATPVNVRSAGSFTFDVQSHTATYEDDVRVFRPTADGDYESLYCDKLTLLFEPESDPKDAKASARRATGADVGSERAEQPAKSAEPSGNSRLGGLGGNLAFRRLKAEGEQVVLDSPANDMRAWMNQLVYDQTTRVAALSAEEVVRVIHGQSVLNAPKITLVHDEEGTVHSAWCRGAGWLKYYDPETRKVELHAQWAKQLRKYPDPDSELDVIELEEKAVVRQPLEKAGLAAELITLWVKQQTDEAGPAPDGPAPRSPQSGGEQRSGLGVDSDRVRLERMVAVEDVAMITTDMEAETDRLEVFFEPTDLPADESRPAAEESGVPPPEVAESGHSSVSPSPTSGQDAPVPPPGLPAESGAAATEAAPEQTQEPYIVSADRIRARVLHDREDRRLQVAEVRTFGNVSVQQKQKKDEKPLELTGDRLHLKNHSDREQTLHVYASPQGEPAHIRNGEMHIQGRKLHLDTAENLAWVEGTGLLQHLVRRGLDGRPLESPQLLDVTWAEKMEFDGTTATFFGDVQAVLAESRMRCQQMQVTLTEKLVFDEADPEGDPPDIRKVICQEGVDLESRVFERGELIELRLARCWNFTLDHTTGETEASGPGWMTFWRRGQGDRAALSPVARVQANKPLRSDTSDWEYVRIDFAGRTEGNINHRVTTFHDRVQIVYGPVKGPPQTIDPEKLPKDGGWLRCRRLQLSQHKLAADKQRTYVKALASGNAELEGSTEGRDFFARADYISYDESKGLYVLRSIGDRTASIWHQKVVGGEFSLHDSHRIEFIPSLKQLKSDRAVGTVGIE